MINEMGAMERLQESYSRCLVEETDLTTTKLKELLESKVNTYLTAEEAVEYGIADHII
jgi:ATP-dependent protease ClpP protease subunit